MQQTLRCHSLISRLTFSMCLHHITGHTAHRECRGIAIHFLDHGTRRGWRVSVKPRPIFTPRKDLVSIVQEGGWAPGLVLTDAENLAPPELDPQTVQPIASHYTNWATRSTQTTEHSLNIIILGKSRVQVICTWPSTYAWDKQQMDSDCLCNKGKGSGCLTATEVTIDRHASKELSIP